MSANRKESKQINFRVSEQEYQQLQTYSAAVGMTVPSFCKKQAQGAKMKAPNVDYTAGVQIASELRKIGVNVNQIAKGINQGGFDSESLQGDLRACLKELNEIWQLLS